MTKYILASLLTCLLSFPALAQDPSAVEAKRPKHHEKPDAKPLVDQHTDLKPDRDMRHDEREKEKLERQREKELREAEAEKQREHEREQRAKNRGIFWHYLATGIGTFSVYGTIFSAFSWLVGMWQHAWYTAMFAVVMLAVFVAAVTWAAYLVGGWIYRRMRSQ